MFIQRSKYYTKRPQPIDKTFIFLRLDNTSPITDVRNHWNGSFLTDSFVNICKSAETGAVWITNYGRLKRTQVKGQCKRIRKHAIRIRTRRGKGLYIHLYPSSIWNSGFIWNLDSHYPLLVVGVGQRRPAVKGVVTQENGRWDKMVGEIKW